MSNNIDIGPKKTMFILVVVIGCFSVLWPKVFYPMLVGNANQQMKPSPIDKTSGCCDVISERDLNIIKVMIELCNSLVHKPGLPAPGPLKQSEITECRKQILNTCGIDIEIILHHDIRIGHSVKRTLNEIRSLNGSLCLKYNFGLAPWKIGVPHRMLNTEKVSSIRQERPAHLRPEMLHPALRERGRAIPATTTTNTLPPRIVDGRPGPIPGMRPPMGGAGHVVPPSQKGTSSMSVIMPIYTIGIVIFFTYTLMKLMFKKPVDPTTTGLYPPVQHDANFKKQVFECERPQYVSRHAKEEVTTKLGWKERDTIVNAMSALLAEVDQQREEDARLRTDMNSRQSGDVTANGTVLNGNAVKPQDETPSVKVVGMEISASCEGGQKWSRPGTPLIAPTPVLPSEPVPPAQSIYLEGALPAQSQLLVSESATEEQIEEDNSDPAVVLSGKMTLSVISLIESLPNQENGTSRDIDETEIDEINDEEEDELINIDEVDDDDRLEESKYTTASNATDAVNDVSDDEDQITDGEQQDEIELD